MTYSGPTLEDLTDEVLDATCMAALGDSVEYASNGSTFTAYRAYVDYGEALRDLQTGQVIEQDITVEMLVSDIARPTSTARITLGRLSGLTFRPVNIRRDNSGTHWQFNVEKVSA